MMCDTPICDFVKKYAESKSHRLHMPGHKGINLLGIEELDITEINGADVLYSAQGIIKRSRENASALFNTKATFYSTEGSSLSIRAMLSLAVMYAKAKEQKPLIAAGRNVHKVFVSAAALLDFDVDWLLPEEKENILSCNITPEYLEIYLKNTQTKPVAVYLTSPDYLGNVLDISALASVCHKYGVMLLVDNAHGAYLHFLQSSRHPIALGADMCADSAHKTLPVLTGGAYLHLSRNIHPFILDNAENALSLFASTSPSYLILQSLDMANLYLSQGYTEKLTRTADRVAVLRISLEKAGYKTVGNEPLKLTLMPKDYGYSGREIGDILLSHGMVCEFYDADHAVMMFTTDNDSSVYDRLENLLISLPRKNPILSAPPCVTSIVKVMSVRDALLSPWEEIPVSESKGRVLANICVSCPPAVPALVCGEVITEEAIKCFEYYGIDRIRVVR